MKLNINHKPTIFALTICITIVLLIISAIGVTLLNNIITTATTIPKTTYEGPLHFELLITNNWGRWYTVEYQPTNQTWLIGEKTGHSPIIFPLNKPTTPGHIQAEQQ